MPLSFQPTTNFAGHVGVLLHTGVPIYSTDDFCFSSVDMTCRSYVKTCRLMPSDVATALCSQTVSCAGTPAACQPAFSLRYPKLLWHFFPPASCLDEESGSLAVVIIPCLLALSTVSVVALIFYSLHKNKKRMQSAAAPATPGTHSNALSVPEEAEARLLCVRLPRR